MTSKAIITFITLLLVTHVSGQTRTLTGKIIDNEFNPLAQVSIFTADTVLLAKSDSNGNFSITVPTRALIVADVGMEWKSLDLLRDCNNLEIILQLAVTYDFTTPAKVDRLRKKEFDKLAGLHPSAFAKGIFKTDKPITGVQKFEDNLDQIFSMLGKHSLDSLEISYQNQYFHRRVGADAFR